MSPTPSRCALLCLLCLALPAVEIHVDPAGNDGAAGTSAAPLRTVQAGINRAVAGDTVVVHAGVYRERPRFPRSGTSGNPIVLSGQAGAAIDGGDVFTGWERVTSLPGNVWRLAGSPYGRTIEMNMTWNGKYIAGIREELMSTTGLDTLSLGPQGWDAYDGTIYRSWDGIEAMFGRLNGYTYVGFGDAAINPNQQTLAFAPEKTDGATILIDGRSWITVRGLTVYNGKFQVYLRGANDCIVEDNILQGGQDTVMVDGGSARDRIRNNDLTLNYVHDLDPSNSRHWFIWAVFKQQSYWDRVAIELENLGADNEVYGNNIHQHWDGIQNIGSAVRLKIHDNTINLLADDGLEPTGDQTDAEWFDNDVSRCNILYRHKGMRSTDTMYVYGNRFYTESAAAWFPQGPEALGIYFFTGTAGTTYFYHNTFVAKQGIATGSTSPATGLPNTWMVNNVFSVDRFWGGAGGFSTLPRFDCNYVGSDLTSRLSWWGSQVVRATPGKLWNPATLPDFQLTATSPAREIGIDLSRAWTMDGVTHPALPGMAPGYFPGTRPDAGAYQFRPVVTEIAPAITTQAANRSVTAGQTATFTVVATGTPAPTYQWQRNTVNISGATGASYTTPATVLGDSGASFRCIATNSAGSATSNAATLTVTAAAVAPAIATQPQARTVTAGQTATFTVVATGTPAPTYQWQKNNVNISGATGASYTTPATVLGDSGATFRCIATNSAGNATSNAATLTVTAVAVAPAIATQPQATTVTVGQAATFAVVATGTPAPTYQWQKNNVNISGATSASYTTPATMLGDSGATFRCIATNSAGNATSDAATLTVQSTPGAGTAVSSTGSAGGSCGSGMAGLVLLGCALLATLRGKAR